ncbi:MAG: hypothetical protein FRX49_10682 [Trebouxia sp. A1-2]|nr:MAG: hypothetical protein FRX49_10682 [Trebouxia sp. A1-2]
MPSRQAAAGESWARPVSASLTAEDCQPSDRAHLVEDLSSIEDDESPGWRDDDPWDAAGGLGREAPSPHGPDDTEEPSASSRHLRSARGNGLDLRPATAAGVFGSQSLNSTSQDANSTRQTDLGSLSAQLFAPRPQSQGGFRPPSRRLSRPPSAQRVAIRQSIASGDSPSVSKQQDAAHQQAPGLVVRGGRKVQSARPSERDQRPPSRQKPPPEALHLFQPMHGSSSGGFAPSPVFRAAPAGTTRPSTSAAIMLQTAAPRFKPSPVLHTGHMTLEDLQKLSDAAVNNSQAIAAGGTPGDRVPIRPYRPPSARPTCARPPSAR